MITPKKSINSRRGGGSTDTSIAWWKILFLVSLILLVSFLVHLNYQLVTELGRPASGKDAKPADDAMSSIPIENRHGQRAGGVDEDRLKDLRRQVSTMKEKVGNMRGMVEEIKQKNADVLPPHRDSIISDKGEFERLTCTPEVARKQADRMNKRFNEWWSHSACPDQVWMENIHNTFDVAMGDRSDLRSKPYLILDIGCNKGYTSADFFDALSPGTNINPHSLVDAIRAIARDMNTKFDRDGGVCNDSNKPLNVDRDTERRSEVHCFEPSPATYNMLTTARSKLMPRGVNPPGGKAMWHMHNKGLHEVNGQMSWHSACASAVGDELCTIVPDGTSGAISVPVVTVDAFLKETYPEEESLLPLVHMLKIDAEGLDPAVLTGSTSLLSQNRAIMVMFEFNPGLSEKGDNRHGMWGKGGNPRKKLLEVTTWLDQLGYDCYLDTKLVDEHERAKAGAKGVPDAPALYRITGDCLTEEPQVRGWANVVCASRQFSTAASMLRNFATMV
ncbi:hypothetical protein ACHAXR_003340 [Thalassiosira sp. AJA248-18]